MCYSPYLAYPTYAQASLARDTNFAKYVSAAETLTLAQLHRPAALRWCEFSTCLPLLLAIVWPSLLGARALSTSSALRWANRGNC